MAVILTINKPLLNNIDNKLGNFSNILGTTVTPTTTAKLMPTIVKFPPVKKSTLNNIDIPLVKKFADTKNVIVLLSKFSALPKINGTAIDAGHIVRTC